MVLSGLHGVQLLMVELIRNRLLASWLTLKYNFMVELN